MTDTIRTVHKYALPNYDDEIRLRMPQGAEIVHVGEQAYWPQIWALIDPDAPMEDRWFRLAGTGHPIEGDVRHVATWISGGGVLVWHLFELNVSVESEAMS